MNKIDQIRSEAFHEFYGDESKLSLAKRALDFTEEWSKNKNFTGIGGLSKSDVERSKKECEIYVKKRLHDSREKKYGFIEVLIGAILFQLLVQIVVRWIMNKFFT